MQIKLPDQRTDNGGRKDQPTDRPKYPLIIIYASSTSRRCCWTASVKNRLIPFFSYTQTYLYVCPSQQLL